MSSLSVIRTSVSTMATAGPPSVKVGHIVHATDRRAVRVEIERRRDVGNDVQEGRADIAVEVTVVDRDLNDAVSSGSARGVEDHLAQGCLVFCQGSLAGEREDAGNGIVGSRGDRYGQHPADREQIAGLRVRQRDRRRFDRSAVGVGNGNVGVGDRYLRPAAGERRGIVRPTTPLESLKSRSSTGAAAMPTTFPTVMNAFASGPHCWPSNKMTSILFCVPIGWVVLNSICRIAAS